MTNTTYARLAFAGIGLMVLLAVAILVTVIATKP